MKVSIITIAVLAIIVINMLFNIRSGKSTEDERGTGGLDFIDLATLILGPLGVLAIFLFGVK